ncbi:MAG: hypothetical protein DME23_22690 [Verrucomicrobia bacterium]|nr:MAG: hypothetical protein DME23_22690 [Verrucomicrobiota bacterium]
MFHTAPLPERTSAPLKLIVPLLLSVRGPNAPPVQFSVPLTVTVPLPLRAPLERSRLETVAELSSVTVTASARIALSAGPGTWLGFQFAAVFQSPPAPLIQVISVARNEGVAAREMQSATG